MKYTHLHRAFFYEDFNELEHPIESTFFHPLGLEIVYSEPIHYQSTEESFGQNSVARQSDLEGWVHLEHRNIRQDLDKGFEIPHILASQSRVYPYNCCICIQEEVLRTYYVVKACPPKSSLWTLPDKHTQ
ncbi:hypothetical protein CDAR_532841 [Caerostris darwini]|uniref:Uncharacterized protein n=1 Tax=Caerostris darwini TaxID=1538125 RepID=A0AAV4WPW4_9ARAC|nr:hypothetical protein CDAR_532841 [Caerostris darwini]